MAADPAGSVLVVGSNPDLRHRLEGLGHAVVECPGPVDSGRCPIVDTGRCKLVEDADGIVFDLDLSDPLHRSILSCYRRRPATGPIAVLAEHPDGIGEMPGTVVDNRVPGDAAVARFSQDVGLSAAARWALADLSGTMRRR